MIVHPYLRAEQRRREVFHNPWRITMVLSPQRQHTARHRAKDEVTGHEQG
jgi:hypothetical protein